MNRLSPIRSALETLLLLAVCLTSACGQEEPAPATPLPPKQKLIEALFESRDLADLEAAATRARKGGVPEQAILEARFLLLVDQQDFAALAALDPVFTKQREQFRIQDSVIFSVPEEFYAIGEYSKALGALEKGDQDGFKRHIMEAFWLSPRQSAAFAPHIERLQLEKAMATLKVDFTDAYLRQDDAKPVTLAQLAGESEHLLVHFWSPWSTQVEANLPDFIAMTQALTRKKIPVASILFDRGEEALQEAKAFRAAITEQEVGEWIVDNLNLPLARRLRVQDLPTVALLARNGTVLFNGHPSDDRLWKELAELAPDLERPQLLPPQAPPEGPLPE